MTKSKIELDRNAIAIEENALMNFQFTLIDAMKAHGITKSALAECLGVTRARVSQLLSSDANPTVKLMARALAVFDLEADYVRRGGKSSFGTATNWSELFERVDVAGLACRLNVHTQYWHDATEVPANENSDEYFEREAA